MQLQHIVIASYIASIKFCDNITDHKQAHMRACTHFNIPTETWNINDVYIYVVGAVP